MRRLWVRYPHAWVRHVCVGSIRVGSASAARAVDGDRGIAQQWHQDLKHALDDVAVGGVAERAVHLARARRRAALRAGGGTWRRGKGEWQRHTIGVGRAILLLHGVVALLQEAKLAKLCRPHRGLDLFVVRQRVQRRAAAAFDLRASAFAVEVEVVLLVRLSRAVHGGSRWVTAGQGSSRQVTPPCLPGV